MSYFFASEKNTSEEFELIKFKTNYKKGRVRVTKKAKSKNV